LKGIIIISSIILLAIYACSGGKSELEKLIGCQIAASQLGQREAQYKAIKATHDYFEEKKLEPSQLEIFTIGNNIKSDWGLSGMRIDDQIETLLDVFNSGHCQDIHGQEDLKLRDILK